MSIEETLRQMILERYHSLREFTIVINMPYSTLNTILKRGVRNSAIGNIITICSALHISADALAEGKIVAVQDGKPQNQTNIEDIIADLKYRLLSSDEVYLSGDRVSPEFLETFLENIDMVTEMAKRYQDKIS